MRRAFGVLAVLCLILGGLVFGESFAADDFSVPPQLRDWQGWVLHGQEQRTCPLLSTQNGGDDDAYQCAWPGRLVLVVDKAGAHFQLDAHVDAESWIDLPGNRDAWPQQVQLGNAAATVLDRNGTPSLLLAAGDYVIRGVFEWDERPARLQVPNEIALVDLNVDGVAIAQPERNDDSLTLGQAAAQRREADSLSLRVFRRLADVRRHCWRPASACTSPAARANNCWALHCRMALSRPPSTAIWLHDWNRTATCACNCVPATGNWF
ncbi:MAG TPA: hypothetical protein VGK80_08710 [Rhodanobacteraceae bacterium]